MTWRKLGARNARPDQPGRPARRPLASHPEVRTVELWIDQNMIGSQHVAGSNTVNTKPPPGKTSLRP